MYEYSMCVISSMTDKELAQKRRSVNTSATERGLIIEEQASRGLLDKDSREIIKKISDYKDGKTSEKLWQEVPITYNLYRFPRHGDYNHLDYDVLGRFTTKDKAKRAMNLCLIADHQVLYTADENGDEQPISLEELGELPRYEFYILEEPQVLEDVFELDGETHDWLASD